MSYFANMHIKTYNTHPKSFFFTLESEKLLFFSPIPIHTHKIS